MNKIDQVIKKLNESGADLSLVIKKMRRANAKLEARIRLEKQIKETG